MAYNLPLSKIGSFINFYSRLFKYDALYDLCYILHAKIHLHNIFAIAYRPRDHAV